MKKRLMGLVLLGVVLISYPAQAAFGGFRAGGTFGVQVLQGRHWYTGNPQFPVERDMVKRLSTIGAIYGGHVGYLFEISGSKFVVGAEAYLLVPGANAKVDLRIVNPDLPIEGSVDILHSRSIGIVAVVGMMFNPKVMVNLSAGMELDKFSFTYVFPPAPGINPPIPTRQVLYHSFKPIVVAIGGTYKVTPHFLVSLEVSSPFFKRFKARMTAPREFHYKPVERRAVLKFSYLF